VTRGEEPGVLICWRRKVWPWVAYCNKESSAKKGEEKGILRGWKGRKQKEVREGVVGVNRESLFLGTVIPMRKNLS